MNENDQHLPPADECDIQPIQITEGEFAGYYRAHVGYPGGSATWGAFPDVWGAKQSAVVAVCLARQWLGHDAPDMATGLELLLRNFGFAGQPPIELDKPPAPTRETAAGSDLPPTNPAQGDLARLGAQQVNIMVLELGVLLLALAGFGAARDKDAQQQVVDLFEEVSAAITDVSELDAVSHKGEGRTPEDIDRIVKVARRTLTKTGPFSPFSAWFKRGHELSAAEAETVYDGFTTVLTALSEAKAAEGLVYPSDPPIS